MKKVKVALSLVVLTSLGALFAVGIGNPKMPCCSHNPAMECCKNAAMRCCHFSNHK